MSINGVTSQPAPGAAATIAVEFHYTQSERFVALLHELGGSLLVSTYQANKLLAVRADGGGLSTLVRTFDRPMGLAVNGGRLALGCRNQVWEFRNAPDIAPRIEPAGRHDCCFLPRSAHITGDIGVHELAWAGDELWVVNTRFSCLCTLDPAYSFVPRWQPPFVSALAAEDRCHLNGLAVVDGQPKYVTALGETDTANGWRADKPRGGCLLEIGSGEVISRGLSMPHSPRWHDGKLWVLESGTGQLVLVDPATGRRQMVAEVPGFARGLALSGPYAFVGLSKIRPTSAMDGVPLAARGEQLKCGVAAVDLRDGRVIALLEFQTAVEEIFDVQLVPRLRFPEVIGFQHETVLHTFVVPPANPARLTSGEQDVSHRQRQRDDKQQLLHRQERLAHLHLGRDDEDYQYRGQGGPEARGRRDLLRRSVWCMQQRADLRRSELGTILNDDGETQALEAAFSDPSLIEEVQTDKRRR